MILPPSESSDIGVIFIGIFSIIHFLILYLSLYYFYKGFGRNLFICFSILVAFLIASPSFVARQQFEYLCRTERGDKFLEDKASFQKFLGKETAEESDKERVHLERFIKNNFHIHADSINLLEDGRLIITTRDQPYFCGYANCWRLREYLIDLKQNRLIALKEGYSFNLRLPYTNYFKKDCY